MMSDRTVSPGVKALLEYGPIAAFFLGYVWLKDRTFTVGGTEYGGFIAVTAAFVPLMIVSTLLMWRLTGKLSKMQVATVVLVVVFGGLSVWLNDERFFKMKPTIIYLLFAAVLGFGLLRGQSYLQAVMGEALEMTAEGWMILTRRLALFFAGLAVANEAVWRLMSTDAWVNFKTFGLTLALFAFFMSQAGLLKKYGKDEG
jgi:intracellular septation protein